MPIIESSGFPISRSRGADNRGWPQLFRHGASLPEPTPWLSNHRLQSSSRGDILIICKVNVASHWFYSIAIAEDCPGGGQWCRLFAGIHIEPHQRQCNLCLKSLLSSLRCLALWSSWEGVGADTYSSTSCQGHPLYTAHQKHPTTYCLKVLKAAPSVCFARGPPSSSPLRRPPAAPSPAGAVSSWSSTTSSSSTTTSSSSTSSLKPYSLQSKSSNRFSSFPWPPC